MTSSGIRPPARQPRSSTPLIACALLALVAATLTFNPALGTGGDNAEYLTLGRAIAQGDGYRMIAEPGAPAETKRWPGYPVFLAGVMLAVGEDLGLLKVTSVLCFAGAAVLAWVYLRRQNARGWWAPAAAVALFVLNDNVLHYASSLYAEALFIVLSLGALVMLERASDPDELRQAGWAVGAALLCAAAIYVRPHGLALIPAAFCFFALRRNWKLAFAAPAVIVVALMPWAWRQVSPSSAGGDTYVTKTLGTREEDTQGVSEARKYADRIVRNASAQFLSMGQAILARPAHVGFRPVEPSAPAEVVAASVTDAPEHPVAERAGGGISPGRASRYLLATLVLIGAVVTWRGAGSSAHWYLIFTAALLLITPWPRGRYLVPLLPFFGWFLVEALLWIADRTGRWIGQPRSQRLGQAGVASACALALLLTAMTASQQTIVNLRNRGLPWWAPQRYASQGLDLANYMVAAAWVRDNAPADATVIARKPYLVYWVSGRAAEMVWSESVDGSWEGFRAAAARGPVYVIEDAFGKRYDQRAQSQNWWRPALAEHPAQVEMALETAPPQVRVWRMLPESLGLHESTVRAASGDAATGALGS